MSTALFVRHRSQPGKRDEIRRVWEKYVKPRAAANPGHEAYYFCCDQNDPDAISVFQLYTDADALKRFLEGAWYNDYFNELRAFTLERPRLITCNLMWSRRTDQPAHNAELGAMRTAMFIRYKCQPGKREEVRRVWEKCMKPRISDAPGYEAYYFCYDQNDPDMISIFQLGTDAVALKRLLDGAWYQDFLNELRPSTAERPRVVTCDLIWSKGSDQPA